MCQANTRLEQAQQKLVVSQLCRRLASVQQEIKEWSHLFGHMTSPLTMPLNQAAEQVEAVMQQLKELESAFTSPQEHPQSNVTYVSR